MPNDRELLKRCHGNTGDANIEGLRRAQFDVLRAYRDGWEWSPFMPKPKGSETTPTTSRCGVPRPFGVTTWEEPMWIVRIGYTATELEMISAEFIVGFEHPRGTNFYSDEVFWRITILAGLYSGEWFMKHQSNDFGGGMYKKPAVFAFKSKGLRRHGAPLRDCGTLHDDEQEIDECNLLFPPEKLFNGRQIRKHACRAEISSAKSRSSITTLRRTLIKRDTLLSSTTWIRWRSLEGSWLMSAPVHSLRLTQWK